MTQITYIDLNETEKGQPHWMAQYREEAMAKNRAPGKARIIAGMRSRYKKRREKERKSKAALQLKYNEDEPRDESGRWTTGGAAGGESFVSPNTEEGTLSLTEAEKRIHSERQEKLKVSFEEIDKMLGADASPAVGAVGAWADGAENSTITIYRGTDYETIKVAGCMKGLLADQKAVLTFKYDDTGDHAMMKATFKGTMQEVHDGLTKAGVEFHTLVHKGDSVEVHVFGSEDKVIENFNKYAEEQNVGHIEASRGHGEFPGSWTSREEGKRDYEATIDRFMSQAGHENYREQWRGMRHNWGKAAREIVRKLRDLNRIRAVEFIAFQKSTGSKIARTLVKGAFARQHARVEKQAAKQLASYFKASVKQIVRGIFGKGFTPDPDNAKTQAEGLVYAAFKKSKQNQLLVKAASQPVADAFLEGAYAELRLTNAAKRRKKQFDSSGRATKDSLKPFATVSRDRSDFPDVKVSTATEAARRAGEEIDFPTEAPEWLTETAQDFILETFGEDYWLRIPETTRDDIELTLYHAIADGKSIRDIAEEINDAHGDEYSMSRATNVARTEITGAMNAGAEEAIRQNYEGSGLTPTKEWLSVLGTTTRETHAEADGQEVGLEEPFIVGGYPCSYPGDASLPPEERCNCQCSIVSSFVALQIAEDSGEGDGGGDEKDYDPNEPRNESGEWTSGGGSSHSPEAPRTESPRSMSAGSQAVSWAREHFPAGQSFTKPEADAIIKYSGTVFKTINSGLRKNAGDTSAMRSKNTVANLDSAIKRGVVPEDVLVYRGMKTGKHADTLQVGDTFRDYGYSSTSMLKSVGERFAKAALVVIKIPKGSNALAMDSVFDGGSNYAEHELVLPRGSSFRVAAIKVSGGKKIISVEYAS